MRDFNLPPKVQEWLAELACNAKLGEELCANVVFLICGFDKAQMNEARIQCHSRVFSFFCGFASLDLFPFYFVMKY